jgi:transposase-like protein
MTTFQTRRMPQNIELPKERYDLLDSPLNPVKSSIFFDTPETSLPNTLLKAVKHFSSQTTCPEFLAALRWEKGPICPRCDSDCVTLVETRNIYKCRTCKKQFSIKVGTIFEDSPIGLDKWLPAAWLIINCKNGVSSYEIARDLEVTQKTA